MRVNYYPRSSHQPPNNQVFEQPVLVSRRRLENINLILEPTQQTGSLFLGDVISTIKEDLLKYHQIRAVLTCMVESTSFLTKE